jgi:hypothetical protein
MNDYRKITQPFGNGMTRKTPVVPMHTNAWHDTAVKFIADELESADTSPAVVLSHHVPYNADDFIPAKYKSPDYEVFKSAYYSDQSKLFKKPVTHWLFGHCHCKMKYNYTSENGDIIVLASNPMGYPGESIDGDRKNTIESQCTSEVIEVKI